MAPGAIVASCLSLAAEISGVAAVSVGVSPLKPAAPKVDRGIVWTDTVKRGPMLRQGGNQVLCL
jgi:HlyD family secretion protein